MSPENTSAQKKRLGIEPLIREIRGQKVILDSDLARLYGVSTKRLNEQVKRNRGRFPVDFMFRLTGGEEEMMRSQFATASGEPSIRQIVIASKRNVRYLSYVFTEHGAVMAANVLNSPRAVQMSVFVVRAFVRMRGMLSGRRELAEELAALDKKLTGRLDIHETAIVDILKRIMTIIDPPPPPPDPPRRRIGFHTD